MTTVRQPRWYSFNADKGFRQKRPPERRFVLPWAVIGTWNNHEKEWVYANLEINVINGKPNDPYYASEYAKEFELIGWMEMPGVGAR